MAIAFANIGDKPTAKQHLDAASRAWPTELSAHGDLIVSADEGVLWFESYGEVVGLKDQAFRALSADTP